MLYAVNNDTAQVAGIMFNHKHTQDTGARGHPRTPLVTFNVVIT